MTALRTLAAISAGVLALSACRQNEARNGASSADSHAPGTTLASAPGACASYAAGAPGVVRTFCNGKAAARINVAGTDYEVKGGTCQTQGPAFSLNIGVVAGPELGGPKPDYVGLTTVGAAGHFDNAILTLTLGGKSHVLANISADVTPAGGTFQGTSSEDGTKVTGSFTC
jgi:hypothetical protein